MPGTRNVVLRPYEPRDLEGTLRLRPRLYPGWPEATDREWHEAVFAWLARGPEGDRMQRWVLDHDGEIVGHLAAVPLPYRIGGRRIVAHTPTDYMALPGYGFHSVNLMRTFFRTCPSYVACNVVGDASTIEGLFRPMPVARLVHGLKILELGTYPRLPRLLPRAVATLAGRAVRAVDTVLLAATASRASNDARPTIREEPSSAFDERFDRLFEAVAAAVPCTVERSSAFLRWRYGPGTPREPFRLLTATAQGELIGYAVLRTTTHDEGFVMDLTTLPDRPEVAQALLAQAIRVFWRDRAFVVRYRFLPSPVSPAIRDVRRLGFVVRHDGGRHLPGIQPERQLELLVRLADPEAQAAAARPEHWTYNLGDGEASFWVH